MTQRQPDSVSDADIVIDVKMDRHTDKRTDGQTDGQTNRWTDRRTNEQAEVKIILSCYVIKITTILCISQLGTYIRSYSHQKVLFFSNPYNHYFQFYLENVIKSFIKSL